MTREIDYPFERMRLANTPTPLDHLFKTGIELGVELYVKRDDLTGAALSGNKIRKLEFLLADALAHRADTVITCGGAQSNHCRATALAAVRCGLRAVLLLRTDDPANPPPPSGNILLDRLAGAEIVWVSRDEYARRDELLSRQAARLREAGRRPYVIPEGGSNHLGAWGYVRCAEELCADLAKLPPRPTTIVYACGSGGTGAGLLAGLALTGLADQGVRAAGINVCDDADYFVRAITGILDGFEAARVPADAIEIVDGYVGRGYAQSQPEELTLIRDIARTEGLVLDPVYTGKAFYGLVQELARDPRRFGERVVFLHTGGIFGLFPVADQLAPLL